MLAVAACESLANRGARCSQPDVFHAEFEWDLDNTWVSDGGPVRAPRSSAGPLECPSESLPFSSRQKANTGLFRNAEVFPCQRVFLKQDERPSLEAVGPYAALK